MKGQKQSRIDLLANKIEVLARVVQGLSQQMEHITNLSIGTHELTKQMPDYEEAIEKLKKKTAEESGKAEEVKAN
jgi:predicted ATP-grasp superfamily ATP-dependent carboligase